MAPIPNYAVKGTRLIPTHTLKDHFKLLEQVERTNPETSQLYQSLRSKADRTILYLTDRKSLLSFPRREELKHHIEVREANPHQIPDFDAYYKSMRGLLITDLIVLANFFLPPQDHLIFPDPEKSYCFISQFPTFPDSHFPYSFHPEPDWDFGQINLNSLVYYLFDGEADMWKQNRLRKASRRGVSISTYSQRILKVIDESIYLTNGIDYEILETHSDLTVADLYDLIITAIMREAISINKPDSIYLDKKQVGFDLDNRWFARLAPVKNPF